MLFNLNFRIAKTLEYFTIHEIADLGTKHFSNMSDKKINLNLEGLKNQWVNKKPWISVYV